MHISFHHTHAYPGCMATLIDDGADLGSGGRAVVEFSDGSMASASYEMLGGDEMILRVGPYTTARRTRIPAKSWKLRRADRGQSWKVAARLDR
jgi:hypothetical protein